MNGCCHFTECLIYNTIVVEAYKSRTEIYKQIATKNGKRQKSCKFWKEFFGTTENFKTKIYCWNFLRRNRRKPHTTMVQKHTHTPTLVFRCYLMRELLCNPFQKKYNPPLHTKTAWSLIYRYEKQNMVKYWLFLLFDWCYTIYVRILYYNQCIILG